MVDYFGLVLIGAIALNLWALTDVWRSGRTMATRLSWTLVLVLPVAGFIAWFLIGPRAAA